VGAAAALAAAGWIFFRPKFQTASAKEADAPKGERVNGVIFCGAPGSGKGTQCEKIIADFGMVQLSTGDMLRAAVKEGTPLGKEADGFMRAGALVPDKLVIGLVEEKLKDKGILKKGWILDGFPRTAVQAEALHAHGCAPDKVIVLDVPDEVLLERVTGRRNDPVTGKIYHVKFNPPPKDVESRVVQRNDDTAEKLQPRLKAYHDNLDAILKYYTAPERKTKVVRVNGNRKADEVYVEVRKEISSKH